MIGVGVVFEFEVTIMTHGSLQDLLGVLTWAGYDLGGLDRHTSAWIFMVPLLSLAKAEF